LKREFECDWEHPKHFSAIKMKNMKALFTNLGIELLNIYEETIERRVYVTFTLKGTEEQQKRLDYYMERIRILA
jgi:hypothetical protein